MATLDSLSYEQRWRLDRVAIDIAEHERHHPRFRLPLRLRARLALRGVRGDVRAIGRYLRDGDETALRIRLCRHRSWDLPSHVCGDECGQTAEAVRDLPRP